MSRCFPFPPPGYEKKTRTGDLDLLLKEKQKEKKHKKEKEKKERKEKREKDGSKEKHKDKDRKERHKDKKREKDREKNKRKARDDQKIKERTANDTSGKSMEKHQAAEERRFADEFIRRIRDDGRNAADQMVEKFNGVGHTQIEGTDRAKNTEVKEKKKEIQIQGLNRAKIVEVKHKNKEKQTEGTDMPRESVEGKDKNKERGSWGIQIPNKDVMGKYKIKEKHDEGIYRPKEDGMDKNKNNEQQVGGIDRPKEEVMGNHSNRECPVQGIDRPKEDSLGKDKNKEWRVEGIKGPKDVKAKEKKKEKGSDSKSKERHKDGGQQWDEKKGKSKDKSREKKEKEREKVKEVLVHKLTEKEGVVHKLAEQKPGESGIKLLSGADSVAAAGHTKNAAKIAGVFLAGRAVETAKTVDSNVRKRKEMELNGILHDGIRPAKLLRPAFGTALPLENGCRVETVNIGVHQAPDKQRGPDNRKPESIAYSNLCVPSPRSKEHKINGKIEPQLLTVSLKPSVSATVVATSTGSSKSSKPPHPDSKYLDQILTVPKMPEWSDIDDQEWLFSSSDARSKQSFQSEIDGMRQVWSEAFHIETADMHALPYVIPH